MRAMLDKLTSWVGLALAAVLLVAGGLLTWANAFVADQVDYQLGMQEITMPAEEAIAELPDADREALEPFVGSPLDTGAEAKAYADHYILAHMNASSDGRTYQEAPTPTRPPPTARPSPGCASRCSWATPCAGCCSTATRSPPSA